jgi:SPASM domain peptide maturase of grasp-with-spasm system
MNQDKLILFANCILTKGYNNYILQDLQKGRWYYVPEFMNEIITFSKNKFLKEIKIKYGKELEDVIDYYVNYLLNNNLAFVTNLSIDLFPPLNLDWDAPNIITNLIIDENHINNNILKKLHVDNVTIIDNESNKEQKKIEFKAETIYVYIKWGRNWKKKLKKYIDNDKISLFIIYDSDTERDFVLKKYIVSFISKTNEIALKNMIPSIPLFTESQNHNTYYNRKVFIDKEGHIKNLLKTNQSFGKIDRISDLISIVKKKEFQYYWKINKEKIDICKDCELRHMCVDSRVPIKRNDNEWYHTKECNYNPFISKWKHEKGYRNLFEIGVISNKKKYFINHNKIKKINQLLSID